MSESSSNPEMSPIRIDYVPASSLNIDRGYQREVTSRDKIEKMSREWDWSRCKALSVSRRVGGPNSGMLFIYDGQHRWLSAIKLFGRSIMLPVIITPLTYEQEALRFAGQHDDETRVSPFARYNANLHGHDEDAMGIESILSKNGMRVVKHSGVRGGVHAVGAIVAIYKAHGGPELLDRTMRVISRVYGDDPDATQSHMILGLSGFLKKFPSISDEELIEKLSRAEGHPNRLAMSAGMYGPVSKGVGMARAILDLWNKGRRSQRLEW